MSEPIDFNKAKQKKLLEDMIFRQQEMENIFADLGVDELQYLKDVLEGADKALADFDGTGEIKLERVLPYPQPEGITHFPWGSIEVKTIDKESNESKDSDDQTT